MKIYYDKKEFFAVTKPIFNAGLYNLPIVADSVAMRFFSWRYEELMAFCEKKPRFHLLSLPKCTYIELNKGVPNAMCYFLAEGDNDPDILHIRRMTQR